MEGPQGGGGVMGTFYPRAARATALGQLLTGLSQGCPQLCFCLRGGQPCSLRTKAEG